MKRLMVGLGMGACLLLACAKNDDTAKNGMTSGQGTSATNPGTTGTGSGSPGPGLHKGHTPAECTTLCTGATDTFDIDAWDDDPSHDTPVCVSGNGSKQKEWKANGRQFIIYDIQPVDAAYGISDPFVELLPKKAGKSVKLQHLKPNSYPPAGSSVGCYEYKTHVIVVKNGTAEVKDPHIFTLPQ